jgi:hypothetical protein
MNKKLLFILLNLVFYQNLQAQESCRSFLKNKETVNSQLVMNNANLEGESMLRTIEESLQITLSDPDDEPTIEELKKLKSPSRLMTVLKRIFQQNLSSFGFILWSTFEPKIFNSPKDENMDRIKRVESVYNAYVDLFQKRTIDEFYPVLAKGKLGSFEAKTKIAKKLKQNQQFFSLIYGTPINLFEESGWLTIFGIDDLSQLSAKIDLNAKLNKELNSRISEMLTLNVNPQSLYRSLIEEFFGDHGLGFKSDAQGFLTRVIHKPLIEDLIRELRLGTRLEAQYMADLELASQYVTPRAYRIPLSYLLIFYRAYLENHPSIPGFTNVEMQDRMVTPQVFLSLQSIIHRNKIIRAVEDEKFSIYIEQSEALNLRRKDLQFKISDLKLRYPKSDSEISKLEEALNNIPTINDFDGDLNAVEASLRAIETSRDLLTEQILENVDLESISLFQDLNYRWERLLPMKAYELKGLDYSHVKFTKNVTDRFARNPIDGARFLSALSKSYVPMKNSSGLRKLPGLPSDFRDIKVIKAGAKIRIVGRLIGKTIHFFHVYESQLGYDNKAMTAIIQNYQP